jgi:hypothetical protein
MSHHLSAKEKRPAVFLEPTVDEHPEPRLEVSSMSRVALI